MWHKFVIGQTRVNIHHNTKTHRFTIYIDDREVMEVSLRSGERIIELLRKIADKYRKIKEK